MKNKMQFLALGLLVAVIGCASVEVKAPKDPIKMDIAMRLDVYQHVVKDADDIESIVEGRSGKGATMLSSVAGFWVGTAYAEDGGLGLEATEAAYRRRDRRADLIALEVKGVLGEANTGLVTARGSSADANAQAILSAENSDRMIIYRAIARKNGSSVQDVQKVYAERIREGLPSGALFQSADGSWSNK